MRPSILTLLQLHDESSAIMCHPPEVLKKDSRLSSMALSPAVICMEKQNIQGHIVPVSFISLPPLTLKAMFLLFHTGAAVLVRHQNMLSLADSANAMILHRNLKTRQSIVINLNLILTLPPRLGFIDC